MPAASPAGTQGMARRHHMEELPVARCTLTEHPPAQQSFDFLVRGKWPRSHLTGRRVPMHSSSPLLSRGTRQHTASLRQAAQAPSCCHAVQAPMQAMPGPARQNLLPQSPSSGSAAAAAQPAWHSRMFRQVVVRALAGAASPQPRRARGARGCWRPPAQHTQCLLACARPLPLTRRLGTGALP